MADETIYNPGTMSYGDAALEQGLSYFPELDTSGHFDFNTFLAEHPELQGRSDIYNVLGGIDVARRIKPGSKKIGYDWSDPYSLSALGGVWALADTMTESAQDWKEGFGDWYRNIKGVGIERDFNPFGLLYDKDEADYYKGYYDKIHKDYQKMQADRWKQEKLRQLKDVVRGPIVGGTRDRPGRIPPVRITPTPTPTSMATSGGGGGWSPGVGRDDPSPSRSRDRGRSRSRGETGRIAGGHHFKYGGIVSVL
tara:strand:- start:1505 stop:2260 length:756 start_codon:yes stop_codon:yes gene_type:complete